MCAWDFYFFNINTNICKNCLTKKYYDIEQNICLDSCDSSLFTYQILPNRNHCLKKCP